VNDAVTPEAVAGAGAGAGADAGAGAAPLVKLVLATHNAHKVAELRRILGSQLDGIELIGYDGPEPVEDGDTFEANALIKARAAAEHTGFAAIADDSGIAVDALGGAPGIHSARYAGNRDDLENLELLLTNLQGVDDRTASFVCAAALVVPAGAAHAAQPGSAGGSALEHTELGVWPGRVLEAAAGAGGFGYDPIFAPDGLDVSSAELSADEKDAQSHRARAFGQIMPVVRSALLGA
jgi:XTP/dITP diphosphohydrolase